MPPSPAAAMKATAPATPASSPDAKRARLDDANDAKRARLDDDDPPCWYAGTVASPEACLLHSVHVCHKRGPAATHASHGSRALSALDGHHRPSPNPPRQTTSLKRHALLCRSRMSLSVSSLRPRMGFDADTLCALLLHVLRVQRTSPSFTVSNPQCIP